MDFLAATADGSTVPFVFGEWIDNVERALDGEFVVRMAVGGDVIL